MDKQIEFTEDFLLMLKEIGKQLKAKKSGFKLIIREDGSGVVEKIVNGTSSNPVIYDFDTLSELVDRFYS